MQSMQSRTAIAQSTEGLSLLDGNAINEECDIALIALLASLLSTPRLSTLLLSTPVCSLLYSIDIVPVDFFTMTNIIEHIDAAQTAAKSLVLALDTSNDQAQSDQTPSPWHITPEEESCLFKRWAGYTFA